MTDLLLEPRPDLDTSALAELLEAAYGVSGELVPLAGERDRNFRVTEPGGRRYLLKAHNPADGADVVEMQTRALAHIGRVAPALRVPGVVPAVDGRPWLAEKGTDGRVCQVQLLTFLDGHHLGGEDLDEGVLVELGRTVALLGRALRGFVDPAASYPIAWDIRRMPELRDRLGFLEDEQRGLAAEVLERFGIEVAPRLEQVRAQVVHNDLSRQNLLVDDDRHVVGITDFGDMTHTALVCDLAVAVADVLDGREDALELAAAMIAGYHAVTPLEDGEARLVADLVAARCVTAMVLTAWRRGKGIAEPGSAGGAWRLLRLLAAEGFAVVASRFASAAGPVSGRRPPFSSPVAHVPLASPMAETAALLARRRAVLGPLELTYDEPLHIVSGEGVYLYGSDGRRYLDAYNNVPVVGHCHRSVVEAVSAQLGVVNTNSRYLHEAGVELAERLVASAPAGLDRVLFVNSGSEANDVAWRIARFATGRRGAIVTDFAYHGVTEATTDLSPEEWPAGFAPPHVRLVAPPTPDRGGPGVTDATAGGLGVAEAVEELSGVGGVAALFVDPVFTSDGIYGPAHRWMQEAVAAVRAAGGLFVADEVQAGYGRTGASLWSIAPSSVEVDLMTLGKPMGNGYPVAAVLARAELVDDFVEATGYFSTFGGGTVACAAGLAVLRVLEEEQLLARAAATGEYLRAALGELAARHSRVASVRGWGLVAGVEVVGDDEARSPDRQGAGRLAGRMKELGVLVGTTGRAGNVLKIRPPLVFDQVHAERLVDRLDEALGTTGSTA